MWWSLGVWFIVGGDKGRKEGRGGKWFYNVGFVFIVESVVVVSRLGFI